MNKSVTQDILLLLQKLETYKASPSEEPALVIDEIITSLKAMLPEESSDNPLNIREQEILELVAGGFSNREIASALGISSKTVEYHLRGAFEKTEATGRTEAVSNAIKAGWLKS